MKIYGYDPETGVVREPPALAPVPDDDITRQREQETAERYRRADAAAVQRRERQSRAARLPCLRPGLTAPVPP